MLRVKTFVSTSPGRGLGLFSAQLIEPDTITWEYDPEFDLSFSREQIDSLPEMNRAILLKYGAPRFFRFSAPHCGATG